MRATFVARSGSPVSPPLEGAGRRRADRDDLERVPLSFEHGRQVAGVLLAVAPEIDADLRGLEPLGRRRAHGCHRRGIRVPRNISLMGFGNFEIGRQCVPALSTIPIDAKRHRSRTGELLLRLLVARPKRGPAARRTRPSGWMWVSSSIERGIDGTRRRRTAGRARTSRKVDGIMSGNGLPQVGLVGVGVMGSAIATRLLERGHGLGCATPIPRGRRRWSPAGPSRARARCLRRGRLRRSSA